VPTRTATTEILDETERTRLPRYITLIRFTEQGARNIKQSTVRARVFAEAVAKAGVEVEAQYSQWSLRTLHGSS
jgi:uncharacterized protein with GYD domain